MSLKLIFLDKTNKNRLSRRRPLKDRKTNFRSIVYSHSSTDPENVANINPVDFVMIVLTYRYSTLIMAVLFFDFVEENFGFY